MSVIINKVGKDTYFDTTKQKLVKFRYKDVTFDEDGWADAKEFRPLDGDLLYIKTKDNLHIGWSQGDRWDGLHFEDLPDVIAWKLHEGVY